LLMHDDKLSEIISDLQRVESQFCRNGFDKKMGKSPTLFLALANTLITAIDDLKELQLKQNIIVEQSVTKQTKEEPTKSHIKVVPKKTSKEIKLRKTK